MSAQTHKRIALISGSSRGLGRALAAAFLDAGFGVVLNGRDEASLSAAQASLSAHGRDILAVAADATTRSGASALIRETLGRFGRLDALINNAGILGPSPRPDLEAFDIDDLAELFRANTLGPVCLTQAALPSLKSSRGVVINVTSDAGATGYPGWGGYGASKAALELISQSWAAELKGEGVRVHAVNPGDLKTEMHQRAFPGEDISDRLDPASVTAIFVWLASEHAAPMSGQRFDAPGFEQPDAAQ